MFSNKLALLVLFVPPGAYAATLDVIAGNLTYTATAGINNSLTITNAAGNYTITDSGETITLTGSASGSGWTGSGTNTVTGPSSTAISSFTVKLLDGTDALNVNGSISVTGAISLQSGQNIVMNSGSLLASGNVTLTASAGQVKEAGAGIITCDTLIANAGTDVILNSWNAVQRVGGSTTTGNFSFTNNQGVIIARLTPGDPTFGINATGNAAVTTSGGGSDIHLQWAVKGATVTLASGAAIIAENNAGIPFPLNKVTATNLALFAETGIGTVALPVATTVSNLAAGNNSSGGIYVSNTGALGIGFAAFPQAGVRTDGPGDIQLVNSGSINVLSDGDNIVGNSNISVQALGAAADVQTAGQPLHGFAAIQGGGTVMVQAGRDLLVGDSTIGRRGDVFSTGGSVVLGAGRDIVVTGCGIEAGNGSIGATAGRNITLDSSSKTTVGPTLYAPGGAINLTTGAGGTFTGASASLAAVASNVGPITISADSMTISQGIDAGTGVVTLQQVSTNRPISLGSGSSALVLSDAAMALVNAGGGVVIGHLGSTFTGGIADNADITAHAGYSKLTLQSAGALVGSAGTVTVTNLVVTDGSAAGHSWVLNSANIREDGNATFHFSSATLTLNGGSGADSFSVFPGSATAFTINGNAPAPSSLGGDQLSVSVFGTTTPSLNISAHDLTGLSGTYSFGGGVQSVNFTGIESGVIAPPAITKAFGAPGIPLNGSTTLTFTLQQANPTPVTGLASLTGVTFADTLPAGLSATGSATSNCGGSFGGTTVLSLTAGVLPLNGSCTITATVTGATAGAKVNITGPTLAFESGPGLSSNTATLQVVDPPTISKSFSPALALVGVSAGLSFTVTNPADNAIALTGLAFTDSLPAGVVVATPNGLTGNCGGGTITAVAGSGVVSLSGATLASGSCTFSVNVVAATAGTKVNTTGAITSTEIVSSNTATSTLTVVNAGSGLAPAPQGGGLVVRGAAGKVVYFDASYTKKYSFGSTGTGNGQFNPPAGVAVAPNGYYLVTDSGDGRIVNFDSNVLFRYNFGSAGLGNGQLSSPAGISVTSAGLVWVVDRGNSRVEVFDLNGAYKFKFGTQGNGNGQLSAPSGVALLPNGYVAVSDSGNNRIQVFDSNGIYKYKFGTAGSGNGQLSMPAGIFVDAAGNFVVADMGNNRVQVFDNGGNYKFKFGTAGTGNGQFTNPTAVMVVPGTGYIWVLDEGNNRVEVFDNNAIYKLQFAANP